MDNDIKTHATKTTPFLTIMLDVCCYGGTHALIINTLTFLIKYFQRMFYFCRLSYLYLYKNIYLFLIIFLQLSWVFTHNLWTAAVILTLRQMQSLLILYWKTTYMHNPTYIHRYSLYYISIHSISNISIYLLEHMLYPAWRKIKMVIGCN